MGAVISSVLFNGLQCILNHRYLLDEKHECSTHICMYFEPKWHIIDFKPEAVAGLCVEYKGPRNLISP